MADKNESDLGSIVGGATGVVLAIPSVIAGPILFEKLMNKVGYVRDYECERMLRGEVCYVDAKTRDGSILSDVADFGHIGSGLSMLFLVPILLAYGGHKVQNLYHKMRK